MVELKNKVDILSEKLETHINEEELKLKKLEEYNLETRELFYENSNKIDKLIEAQEQTNRNISGLVEAWNTAGAVAKFLRWCAGIGAALYFFIEVFKGKT